MQDVIRRLPWVLKTSGLSKTTIWRLEKEGAFPKRVKLGPQAVGWRESEVLKWIETLQAA